MFGMFTTVQLHIIPPAPIVATTVLGTAFGAGVGFHRSALCVDQERSAMMEEKQRHDQGFGPLRQGCGPGVSERTQHYQSQYTQRKQESERKARDWEREYANPHPKSARPGKRKHEDAPHEQQESTGG
eukprot:TRINITY_DN61071_c0_g1_i1.p1 TRINITY_DN61071_c0_g1~~TRINITY_DN61071_c0_g1_i1.p1  ORF type:complete len:128 (+),score=17.10 TRINITY_DN61071_c0_g1_i1:201-584(+)